MGEGARTGSTRCEGAAYDVVIVGCGVGGLYTALNLPRELSVVMLSKASLEECDSMLAQGGICVLRDADDYRPYFRDTMRAGHWENRRGSVDAMIRTSRAVIDELVGYGVDFERKADGSLDYTREGAHGWPRICYHADVTGREITTTLLARVRELPNVRILENVEMVDIIEEGAGDDRHCAGVVARQTRRAGNGDEGPVEAMGDAFELRAPHTVWATGGIGGTYERSTNYRCLTGDACRIAREHGIGLEHMDYVQIHPTGLWSRRPGRTFLISESCRGEGAVLLNAAGERFVDELLPRDVVAQAILDQMRSDGTDHEWLSFAPIDPEVVRTHFAHIYGRCLEEGYDILREPIPVVPTQHYFMGGVHVDTERSATTLAGLYAVGETSCNGVHGRNRLASNSLLEGLVFARRAARDIARERGFATDGAGGSLASDAALAADVPPAEVRAELSGDGEPAAGTPATDPASAACCEQAQRQAMAKRKAARTVADGAPCAASAGAQAFTPLTQ